MDGMLNYYFVLRGMLARRSSPTERY